MYLIMFVENNMCLEYWVLGTVFVSFFINIGINKGRDLIKEPKSFSA